MAQHPPKKNGEKQKSDLIQKQYSHTGREFNNKTALGIS